MNSHHCPDMAGCFATATLPTPAEATAAHLDWPSPAAYWPSDRLAAGRSVPPDLKPPIPFV